MALAMVWVRLYGIGWALGGIALILWGAPAASRYFERGRRVQVMDPVRPLMARLARVMLRFVGAATVLGCVLIALFPDQL
jgi:hypothetical protein